ncbi:hypothetical protein ACT19C_004401 [Escherichia coli]
MKTQLKLELNMKKTLLAQTIKAIGFLGLSYCAMTQAATTTTAHHDVEADVTWSISFVPNSPTKAGMITDTGVRSFGEHWGDLIITNDSDFAGIGLLTSDTPNNYTSQGFDWTNTSTNNVVRGFLHNPALQGPDLSSVAGVRVYGSANGVDEVPAHGRITVQTAALAGDIAEAGTYEAVFHIQTHSN